MYTLLYTVYTHHIELYRDKCDIIKQFLSGDCPNPTLLATSHHYL